MEFSPFGNLRDFLRRHEGAFNFGIARLTFLSLEDLHNFGFQIASGMEYLWHKKVMIQGQTASYKPLRNSRDPSSLFYFTTGDSRGFSCQEHSGI